MPLKLFYITNRREIALIAEDAGVDRIFLDMEYIGKQDRQGGMDTVQNHHTIQDIKILRNTITKAELLVRVNPIHDRTNFYSSSDEEIEQAIDSGADILMLPMYKSVREVDRFLSIVDHRVKTMLLCETPEAVSIMPEIVKIDEIDEIHIGLNDLHLAMKKGFMFELLSDGTVDRIADVIRPSGKRYGFGGIARIGYGTLPAEKIIAEHYRIGSQMAILSRSFCNAEKMSDLVEIRNIFDSEVRKIRETESLFSQYSPEQFDDNRMEVVRITNHILQSVNN